MIKSHSPFPFSPLLPPFQHLPHLNASFRRTLNSHTTYHHPTGQQTPQPPSFHHHLHFSISPPHHCSTSPLHFPLFSSAPQTTAAIFPPFFPDSTRNRRSLQPQKPQQPPPSPSSPTPSPQQPVLSSPTAASRCPTTTIAFLQLLPPPTPAEPLPSAILLSHLSPPCNPSSHPLIPPRLSSFSRHTQPPHRLSTSCLSHPAFSLLISFFILSTHRSDSPVLPSPQTTTAASSPPTTAHPPSFRRTTTAPCSFD